MANTPLRLEDVEDQVGQQPTRLVRETHWASALFVQAAPGRATCQAISCAWRQRAPCAPWLCALPERMGRHRHQASTRWRRSPRMAIGWVSVALRRSGSHQHHSPFVHILTGGRSSEGRHVTAFNSSASLEPGQALWHWSRAKPIGRHNIHGVCGDSGRQGGAVSSRRHKNRNAPDHDSPTSWLQLAIRAPNELLGRRCRSTGAGRSRAG